MGRYPHLPLTKSSGFVRKKRMGGFGYVKADRDADEFYKTEIKKLDLIGGAYKKDREAYNNYFDPGLIFKIKLINRGMSSRRA